MRELARERKLAEALLGDEQGRREVTKALLEITSRTAANADGDVGVGLSVLVDGDVHSIGATSDPAQRMDHGQAADGDGPCLQALRTGEPVTVADYSSDKRWPDSSRRAAEAGIRSSLSLPLRTRQQVLGALNVYSNAPDAFGEDGARSLTAFAQQATSSLLLLGQLQAQRADSAYVTAFSHTIQASLRTVLPDVLGLELMGASMPWSPHAAVGGDWYDAFVLPDGSLGLVIGDVMGHGVEAVSAMAQVRTMVRTAASAGLSPAAVLQLTDQLAHQSGIDETVTLFYANLRTESDGTWLRYCNAGHPYPLLRHPDGTVMELQDGTRVLLGAIGTGPRLGRDPDVIGTAAFPPGSVLLLYTDGLIERATRDDEEVLAALRRTLAALDESVTLEQLCRRLLVPPSTSDDTTVLAVRSHARPRAAV